MNDRKYVYHLHIRKTGGRSVHHAVFKLAGGDPVQTHKLLNQNSGRVLDVGGYKLCGWPRDLTLEFDYAYAHHPLYRLQGVTNRLFMMCCLRDPVERFLSHWKMLRDYAEVRGAYATPHPGLEAELKYYNPDPVKFFHNLPMFDRLTQLHMFSETGNLEEASRAVSRMRLILEIEDLGVGVQTLLKHFGQDANEIPHVGASTPSADIEQAATKVLRASFESEYRFLDAARSAPGHYSRGQTG